MAGTAMKKRTLILASVIGSVTVSTIVWLSLQSPLPHSEQGDPRLDITRDAVEAVGVQASLAPVGPRTPPVAAAAQPAAAVAAPATGGLKVAMVIAVTKEPVRSPEGPFPSGYLDGAAILKNSALRHMAKYAGRLDFIALTGPNSAEWNQGTTWRHDIEAAGWKIRPVNLPVEVKDVQGAYLREELPKSGCCGPAEIIKLEVFRMTEYDRIIIVDADSLVLQPVDELIEDTKHDAIWTLDRGLGGGCMNGGFLVLNPAQSTYDALVDTFREGDFQDGGAWGGKNIGWCYGGQTFQGIIPYFFQHRHKNKNAWREADSAYYNNMANDKTPTGRDQDQVPLSEIKTFHFTVCQKPWDHCSIGDLRPLCEELHDAWWKERNVFEKEQGQKATARCDGNYPHLSIYK